jgi:hypothetical protein
MSRIADVVTTLIAAPVPILLLDTCAFLDIIRAPVRRDPSWIEPAIRLRAGVSAQPRKCGLVVASLVGQEWTDSVATVVKELSKHLRDLDAQAAHVHDACNAVGISLGQAKPLYAGTLLNSLLHDLSRDLMNVALALDGDDALKMRAVQRVFDKIPPSRKGGQLKDCTILEECLELCRGLRAGGFAEKCVFCTSNRTDFCETGNNLHANLAAEFGAVQLTFTTELNWALHELGI